MALPQAEADERHAAGDALSLLFWIEIATENRLHAKRGRPAFTAINDRNSFRLDATRQSEIFAAERHHGVEDLVSFMQDRHVLAVHPERAAMAVRSAVGIEQAKDTLRLRERNRPKENSNHQAAN